MQWGPACTAWPYPRVPTPPRACVRANQPLCLGFIQDLIAAVIDVIFSPFEAIFAPLIDPLVDLIGLPDIGFSVSVSPKESQNGVLWCGRAAAYIANLYLPAARYSGLTFIPRAILQ